MAYTLQRKMFKLGGSVAHGGGITANLKNPNRKPMKKGGRVETETTPVGVGSGNQPMVPGPDGKMREAHVGPAAPFLPFLMGLGTVGLRSIPALLRGLGSRSTKPISDFVMKSATGAARPTAKQIAKMTDAEKLRTLGRFGEGPVGRLSQIGRGAATGVGALAPVGLASSLFPELEKGKDKPIRSLVQNLREVPELALNTAVGIPSGVVGALAGQGMAGFTPSDAIQTSLYGSSPTKITQSPTGEVATRQVSEMERLKNAALERKGLYESLMYEPDKLALASNALLSAGTSALRGDELADVIESGFAPINTEAARRREISSASSQQAITDILNDKAARQQVLAKIAESGDTAAIARVKKFFEASDQGVDNQLPLDAKGGMDRTQMTVGTIYADIENATGKLFVAVNESGSEIKQFDTIEEAIEHSQKP